MASEPAALSDPATFAAGIPHAEFARLRREQPVAWIAETPLWRHGQAGAAAMTGSGYWAVTRHADVTAVSRAPELFSSAERGVFLADPRTRTDLERNRDLLIAMDPPRHTAIRRMLRDVFTPRAVRRLHGAVQRHTDALVEAALAREHFDAVRDLAAELPLLVLADLLGMPRGDRHLLYQWSNHLVGFDDPEFGGGDLRTYQQTFAESFRYARDLAAHRRRHPGDDLISTLIAADPGGPGLSEAQFCNLWILLVVAGNETTRNLLSGSLLALAHCPPQRELLAADPGLMSTAIEELCRWVTPIMQFRRTAVTDTRLAGQHIRPGDKVLMYYIAANRDEAAFARADQLDLRRRPNPHLAFGLGAHFCLGAHLARLEAATMLTRLVPHLARFELDGPVVRLASNFMNGIKSMPARFAR